MERPERRLVGGDEEDGVTRFSHRSELIKIERLGFLMQRRHFGVPVILVALALVFAPCGRGHGRLGR